jgi:hypothetical protein
MFVQFLLLCYLWNAELSSFPFTVQKGVLSAVIHFPKPYNGGDVLKWKANGRR